MKPITKYFLLTLILIQGILVSALGPGSFIGDGVGPGITVQLVEHTHPSSGGDEVVQELTLKGLISSFSRDTQEEWVGQAEDPGGPCAAKLLEQLKKDLKDYPELDAWLKGGPNRVKAWEGLFNAPDFIRRNTTVLGKADELLAAGFTKVDLDFLSGTLNKFKGRNLLDADLEKIAGYALEARKHTNQYSGLNIETDLFKQIDELASSTKFKNPEDLKSFLSEQQLLQNIADNPGNLEALNEAVRVLKNGEEVLLEGKGVLKGDIVNVTKTESIQYKAFTGTSNSTTTTNLKKAAEQFVTEPPASGYKKIAKLKILDSANPEFNSSAIDLKNRFQQYLNNNISNQTGNNLRALNEIRVDNAQGLSRFEIINNVVTIIP